MTLCERCLDPAECVLKIKWPNSPWDWPAIAATPVCDDCHEALHELAIEHQVDDEAEAKLQS